MAENPKEKQEFLQRLRAFASTLAEQISQNGEWTIKGFIDVFKNVYTISADTKIVSKVLEIHLFPHFLNFANEHGYEIELATHQNWYPDLTFISKENRDIKFAVDLKTTYRDEKHPDFCNGFTLGSHGEYFVHRESSKNIQYPYSQYSGHFCVGIIYSRAMLDKYEETKRYSMDDLSGIPSVIHNFTFFAEKNGKLQAIKAEAETPQTSGVFKTSKIYCMETAFLQKQAKKFLMITG